MFAENSYITKVVGPTTHYFKCIEFIIVNVIRKSGIGNKKCYKMS